MRFAVKANAPNSAPMRPSLQNPEQFRWGASIDRSGFVAWSHFPVGKCSGQRHLAGRTVGPVAIEPGHAPSDAPARPDHARILGDRIMDGVLAAVRDLDHGAAEPARYGVGRPRAERSFANAVEAQGGEVGVPVLVFLVVE